MKPTPKAKVDIAKIGKLSKFNNVPGVNQFYVTPKELAELFDCRFVSASLIFCAHQGKVKYMVFERDCK